MKYIKSASSYILKKRHQLINGGTVYERDMVTIGGWDRFIPGKQIYIKEGNFVFTINNLVNYQRRVTSGKWSDWLNYGDVANASALVNNVKVNQSSNDIRDYAYYGSAAELVRVSLEHIIRTYPGYMASNPGLHISKISYVEEERENDFGVITTVKDKKFQEITNTQIISNPFNINLWRELTADETETPLHHLPLSYADYCAYEEGEIPAPVTAYSITWLVDQQKFRKCRKDYVFTEPILRLRIKTASKTYTIDGYWNGEDFVFARVSSSAKVAIIRPQDKFFIDFFDSLSGFENQLLSRKTKPLYKTSFLTPQSTKFGAIMSIKDYVYPSTSEGLLNITSMMYADYVRNLMDMAERFDKLSSDNIYQRMTHEAIKNFDWSYTRNYAEGDSDKYIEGGTRVAQFLRLLGRGFDDIKRHIDGVNTANTVTYNGFNNMPEALMSDTLDGRGWDMYSIIPADHIETDENYDSNLGITIPFLTNGSVVSNETSSEGWRYSKQAANVGIWQKDTSKAKQIYANYNNWHCASDPAAITPDANQLMFERELMLSNAYISNAKGTIASIDMVFGLFGFGGDDYELEEDYYITPLWEVTDISENETTETLLASTNRTKAYSSTFDEDDELYGLPIEVQTLKVLDSDALIEKDYLVPYYTQNKLYDGFMYFQQKGGWGDASPRDSKFDYKETVNYTRAVGVVDDLDRFGYNDIANEEIVYVNNILTYIEQIAADNEAQRAELSGKMTHYFQFLNTYSFIQKYSDSSSVIQYETMLGHWVNLPEDDPGVQYVSNLVNNTKGNNPHVGYGQYDNGISFINYMNNPFYYTVDKGRINTDKVRWLYDKIHNTAGMPETPDEYSDAIELSDLTLFGLHGEDNHKKVVGMGEKCVLYCDYVQDSDAAVNYTRRNNIKDNYVVNSKRLTIKFGSIFKKDGKINQTFKRYFEGAMLPYIMQVIPSTTILMLDYGNEDEQSEEEGEKKKYELNIDGVQQTDYYQNRNSLTDDSDTASSDDSDTVAITLANSKSTQFSFNVESICTDTENDAELYSTPFTVETTGDWLTVAKHDNNVTVYVDANTTINTLADRGTDDASEDSDATETRMASIVVANTYNNGVAKTIDVYQPSIVFDLRITQDTSGNVAEWPVELDDVTLQLDTDACNNDFATTDGVTQVAVCVIGDKDKLPTIGVEEYVTTATTFDDDTVNSETYIDFDEGLRFEWKDSAIETDVGIVRMLNIKTLRQITPNSHYIITLTHPDYQEATCIIRATHAVPAATLSVGARVRGAMMFAARRNVIAFTNQGVPTTTDFIPVSSNSEWYYKLDDQCDWINVKRNFEGLTIEANRNNGEYRETTLTIGLSNDSSQAVTYSIIQEEASDFGLNVAVDDNNGVFYNEETQEISVSYKERTIYIGIESVNGYRDCILLNEEQLPDWITGVSKRIVSDDGIVRKYKFCLDITANDEDDIRTCDITFVHGNDETVRQSITLSQFYKEDMELRLCTIDNEEVVEVDYQTVITEEQSLFYVDIYPEDCMIDTHSWSKWIVPNVIVKDGHQYLQVTLLPNEYMLPREGKLTVWNKDKPIYNKVLKFSQAGML